MRGVQTTFRGDEEMNDIILNQDKIKCQTKLIRHILSQSTRLILQRLNEVRSSGTQVLLGDSSGFRSYLHMVTELVLSTVADYLQQHNTKLSLRRYSDIF
jgi:hypothetical protein